MKLKKNSSEVGGVSIRKISLFFFTFFLFTVIQSNQCFAQKEINDAYALFIYNFAKYSEWPDNKGHINIVIYGNDDVTKSLTHMSANKMLNGNIVGIKDYNSDGDLNDAQIVFVAKSETNMLPSLLEQTEGKPVMIITEKAGLTKKGADISFFIDANSRLKFSLNETTLDQRHLKMAVSLKSMAR